MKKILFDEVRKCSQLLSFGIFAWYIMFTYRDLFSLSLWYSERLLAHLEKDSKLPECGSDPIFRAKKLTAYLWIRAKIARKFDCKFIVCCFTCIHMVQFSHIWHHACLRHNGVKCLKKEHSVWCLIKFWHTSKCIKLDNLWIEHTLSSTPYE